MRPWFWGLTSVNGGFEGLSSSARNPSGVREKISDYFRVYNLLLGDHHHWEDPEWDGPRIPKEEFTTFVEQLE